MTPATRSTPGLRFAMSAIAVVCIALFVVNTMLDSSASRQRASEYFSNEVIDRGLEFNRQRNLLSWCARCLHLALLTAIVCTTLGRRVTDCFNRLTGQRWLLTLLLVGAAYYVVDEILWLPLGLARLEHARAWNMTERSVSAWFVDWSKELAFSGAVGLIMMLGLYSLIRFFPRRWWLFAGVGATVFSILYAFLVPEFIQPLFNTFTPLEDPYLRERVRVLARRADVPVDEVLVMDASSRGRHTNAYFTGFFSTRRIVLYDTLVRSHSGVDATSTASLAGLLASGTQSGPLTGATEILAAQTLGADELESILAHEMGHWQHHHIVKGILLGSVACFIGFYLLACVLRWAVGRRPFALSSPADPAGLPLILLLIMLSNWLTLPAQNTVSRYFERQADAASLELADKPEAFIEAEKRLARDNLSNVAPAPLNVWIFGSHPTAVERIEMAEKAKKSGAKK